MHALYIHHNVCTFQRNHFRDRIHDRRIGRDGTPHWILWICHVDDDDLLLIADLLSNADKLVRLHSEIGETDVCGIYAKIRQLKNIMLQTLR